MNQKTPEIGIALAAYKPHRSFFLEQLNSIQNQTFTNWVCLITLDSELPEYLSEDDFAHISSDQRFIFIVNQIRLGHKKNFEHAAKLLCENFESIKYISFSDQDDIWYPNKLSISYNYIDLLPEYSATHSDMNLLIQSGESFNLLLDHQKKPISSFEFEGKMNLETSPLKMIACNHVAGAGMLMDKKIVTNFGDIPDSFEYHDHWYALIAVVFGKLTHFNEQTYAYRQHGKNVIGAAKKANLLKIRSKKNPFNFFQNLKLRAMHINNLLPRQNQLLKFGYIQNFDFGLILFCSSMNSLLKKDTRTARPLLGAAIGKFVNNITFGIFSNSKPIELE